MHKSGQQAPRLCRLIRADAIAISQARSGRSMRRRLLIALGAGALTPSLVAFAQQSGKPARVGFLYFGSRQSAIEAGRYHAFVQGMRELGYIEGKSLVIDLRFADGNPERSPALVAELIKLNPDVIVATGSATYRALQLATGTIPIVLTVGVDPVAGGYAASMAKPGRNFTGLTDTAADLNPKLLELAMTIVPKLTRIGVPDPSRERFASAAIGKIHIDRAESRRANRPCRSEPRRPASKGLSPCSRANACARPSYSTTRSLPSKHNRSRTTAAKHRVATLSGDNAIRGSRKLGQLRCGVS